VIAPGQGQVDRHREGPPASRTQLRDGVVEGCDAAGQNRYVGGSIG
jgi:hypothetical protein